MNSKTLKILLSLFILNSITLYFYFSSHPDYFRRKPNAAVYDRSSTGQRLQFPDHYLLTPNSNSNKPWPILPSYLPWTWSLTSNNVPFRSCEAYFGNGFTRRVDLLQPSAEIQRRSSGGAGGGWFRCFYSETLRSSICEGGRLRMHPDKIKMSIGGEELETVIGRGEEEELPEFEFGAFDLEVAEKSRHGKKLATEGFLNQYLQRGVISRHTMRELVDSIQLVDAHHFECSEWIEEPTLLITRFEYANLFHTVTDWYSAYASSRVTGLPNRPRLVFVDGHCMTPLEETWKAVFSDLRYAKNFSGPVCFRHAVLSPLGYETAMFKGLSENVNCHGASAHDLWQNPDDSKTARISEFGEMIRAAFGLPLHRPRRTSKSVSQSQNVLFVRREDYLAHPRHGGKVQSRLSNEEEIFEALKIWASSHSECRINLVNGLFAHMPMKQQVKAIQDASVIIGAHGAGLTHIVSATPEAEVLEIIARDFTRPHFELISKWKGLKYHPIYLSSSYANPTEVIGKLRGILKSLGC